MSLSKIDRASSIFSNTIFKRPELTLVIFYMKWGCGKSLYPFQSRSGWGSDQNNTIRYYYCKYGKDLKTTAPECKAVLIREQYPPHSVKPGACRNGNGLVEFIFPLLLPTLIRQLIEPEDKGRLTEQAEQKQRDLDEINGIERKLLDKNLVGIITEEQFNNLMAEYRVKRDKLTRELKALNDKLGGMIDTQLPIETLLKRPFLVEESKATKRSQIEVGGSEIQLELG